MNNRRQMNKIYRNYTVNEQRQPRSKEVTFDRILESKVSNESKPKEIIEWSIYCFLDTKIHQTDNIAAFAHAHYRMSDNSLGLTLLTLYRKDIVLLFYLRYMLKSFDFKVNYYNDVYSMFALFSQQEYSRKTSKWYSVNILIMSFYFF